eukprot:2009779-Pyramimonas_sp.AAC.1
MRETNTGNTLVDVDNLLYVRFHRQRPGLCPKVDDLSLAGSWSVPRIRGRPRYATRRATVLWGRRPLN